MRLNLVKLFFRTILLHSATSPGFLTFLEDLKELHLQFYPHFLKEFQKTGVLPLSQVRPIGRDCEQLEKHLGPLLTKLRNRTPGPGTAQVIMRLELLWARYCMVHPYLVSNKLGADELAQCRKSCAQLCRYYEETYPTLWVTTYLHWVSHHLPTLTTQLVEAFGFSYGVMSTQGSEHRNKEIKAHIKHTLRNTGSLRIALVHLLQRRHGWPMSGT